jgi:hypothetical protein
MICIAQVDFAAQVLIWAMFSPFAPGFGEPVIARESSGHSLAQNEEG